MTKTQLLSKVGLIFLSTVTFNTLSADANVDNRCIVKMKDSILSNDVKGIANAFAKRNNTSIKHVYKHSIKGFAINMPCHAAQTAFGDNAYIESMEADAIISINARGGKKPPKDDGGTTDPEPSSTQEVSYGTTRVGGSLDGTSKTAWVIDTGVDLNHPDLNVDTSRGFSAVRGGMDDQNGHGTHVAGTIGAIDNTIGSLGVAQNATIVSVRVLDRRGSGTISGVIAGVDYVAENANAGDCVNMSLGGGISTTLDDSVISASQASNAYFTLAAGNESDDASNHSPARVNGENIWTISAIDSNDATAYFSNYGTPVDYAAPGVGIFSLWKNGGTNTISGTSMAAPHACAVLMMSNGTPNTSGLAISDPDGEADPIIHY